MRIEFDFYLYVRENYSRYGQMDFIVRQSTRRIFFDAIYSEWSKKVENKSEAHILCGRRCIYSQRRNVVLWYPNCTQNTYAYTNAVPHTHKSTTSQRGYIPREWTGSLSSTISLSLFGFMRSFICILRVTIWQRHNFNTLSLYLLNIPTCGPLSRNHPRLISALRSSFKLRVLYFITALNGA